MKERIYQTKLTVSLHGVKGKIETPIGFVESSVIFTSNELNCLKENLFVLRPIRQVYSVLQLTLFIKIKEKELIQRFRETGHTNHIEFLGRKFVKDHEHEIWEKTTDIICDGGFKDSSEIKL